MFSLLLAWTNCWTKCEVACDLRCHDAHVMSWTTKEDEGNETTPRCTETLYAEQEIEPLPEPMMTKFHDAIWHH